MFQFKAYFLKDNVYIDQVSYRNNEILTALLNMPEKNLEGMIKKLELHKSRVQLKEEDYEHCVKFNGYAHNAQAYLHTVGRLIRTIPVYKNSPIRELLESDLLFDCFNREFIYWEDGCDVEDPPKTADFENEYGFCVKNKDGGVSFIYEQFVPAMAVMLKPDAEVLRQIDATNAATAELFDKFIQVIEDLIRVRKAYAVLLDQYINAQNRYLTEKETAEVFTRFVRDTEQKPRTEQVVSGGLIYMRYEIYRKMDRSEHLCEANTFDGLGAFLYFDFFRGLEKQYIPRRCDNCGRYFLQWKGKYSSYCDEPLKEDPRKTCRDVGARKKYDDKCKTDPVWLAYNRAYKAHYARYMKKNMTTAEFEKWSRYAVELREQAEAGKIALEDYQIEIKK